ncbi:uncharacterized protein LOC118940301 [Oncorhynchus mykiss]|uniref:uncharacterized protein LOC118940301 n=1 Tax=Oncorhynchus mykiss TaxID=8022 RepID=UPI001877B9F2|nr:uncharacterized protein LOC118940301 [Oncorhynchus mykiss]
MAVQTAASSLALYLYPFHAVTKRETTGRIVSRDLSSTYTSPETQRRKTLHCYDGVAQHAINEPSPTSVRTQMSQMGHLIYLREERRMTPPCPCPTSMTVSHQSLHSGRPLHRPLNPSQVPVVTPPDDTAPAASQDPGDDEYIGPDGVSGYQHVVLLATSQPLPPPPSLYSTSLPINASLPRPAFDLHSSSPSCWWTQGFQDHRMEEEEEAGVWH